MGVVMLASIKPNTWLNKTPKYCTATIIISFKIFPSWTSLCLSFKWYVCMTKSIFRQLNRLAYEGQTKGNAHVLITVCQARHWFYPRITFIFNIQQTSNHFTKILKISRIQKVFTTEFLNILMSYIIASILPHFHKKNKFQVILASIFMHVLKLYKHVTCL
jgi:hypothetical protein